MYRTVQGLNLTRILYERDIPVLVRTAIRCTAPWWAGRRGSWTSFVPLTIFVCTLVVQHGDVVGDGPRMSCSRAAMAVWIRKLDITSPRGDEVPASLSADEAMLDWLVPLCGAVGLLGRYCYGFSPFLGICYSM